MTPRRPEADDDSASGKDGEPTGPLELPEAGTGARARLRAAREAAARRAGEAEQESRPPIRLRTPLVPTSDEPGASEDSEDSLGDDSTADDGPEGRHVDTGAARDDVEGYTPDPREDLGEPEDGLAVGGEDFDFEPLSLFGTPTAPTDEEPTDEEPTVTAEDLPDGAEPPGQRETLGLVFAEPAEPAEQVRDRPLTNAPIIDAPKVGDPGPVESPTAEEPENVDEPTDEVVAAEDRQTAATDGRKRSRWSRRPRIVSPPPPRAKWRRVAFATTLMVLLCAGAGLGYLGVRTVSESTEGKIIDVTDDPDAPGFEALVTPSPTMLLIHHEEDQVLGYTFLVLGPGDKGGAVVFIPTGTLAELPSFGDQPVSLAYTGGGSSVALQVVQNLLGTGILESVEIENPRWTTLTEPVAPFAIDSPDEVVITDPDSGEAGLLFPSGAIEVEAVGVGQYLGVDADGRGELDRLVRNEIFWRAWLDAITAADQGSAVPGESDSGIGRFARGLAAGPVEILTLPVDPADRSDDDGEDDVDEDLDEDGDADEDEEESQDEEVDLFEPRTTEIEALITELVPLPTSPEPGVRPKVRLLNGTPDRDLLGTLVRPLVDAGAEVAIFGNASSFSESTTRIIFSDGRFSDDVRAMQDALGVGEIVRAERPVENIDITIVVGEDYTGEER